MMTDTKHDALMEIGKNSLSCLRDMVAALNVDYYRLEALEIEMEDACTGQSKNNVWGKEWLQETADDNRHTMQDGAQELLDLRAAAGDCKDRDEAEQRIHEDPLSIEFRSGWETDRSELATPAEARILLSTGGPAVQIIVELDRGEPTRAVLQVQDWGTPWTDYYEPGISDTLMAYVACFFE